MIKNYKSVQLPANYAWELLQNEIELEVGSKITIGLVQKLLELYALGVEYYESLRSYKYRYFQKKMNCLMISPQVMHAMNINVTNPEPVIIGNGKAHIIPSQNSSSSVKAQQQQQEHHRMLFAKTRQDEIEKQMIYSSVQASAAKVKFMIENTEQQANQMAIKIKNELSKQNSEILDKVEKRRKRALLSKSFSLADMTRNSSNDLLESPGESVNKQDLRLDKIKVDFGNIINENEEDEQDREKIIQRKNTEDMVVIPQHKISGNLEEKNNELPKTSQSAFVESIPKVRKRNNTLILSQKRPSEQLKQKHTQKTYSEGLPQLKELSDIY